MQSKLLILTSHSILTQGQPVPTLTLLRQMPDRIAIGVPILIPIWTHLPQVTQLSDMCCLAETPAKLVYCDISLQITAKTMQLLPLTGQNKKHITTTLLTTVNKLIPNCCKDNGLTSLLRALARDGMLAGHITGCRQRGKRQDVDRKRTSVIIIIK